MNFTDDGWFRTGDEAVTEEAVEGRPMFAFRDRMGDVLRLARYKVPIRVLPIDEFPTTPSANGTKIQKIKLREMAAEAVTET